MQTSDFDYNLPKELIAQTPKEERSSSKLLVLNRADKTIEDKRFSDILAYLNPGDALVLNETKVLPARIFGVKSETNGKVELLLLKDLGNDTWQCLARPQKRLKPGTKIDFYYQDNHSPLLHAEVIALHEEGITDLKFSYSGIFLEKLERLGSMPLPPYIHQELKDKSRYQTVYAEKLGSAAAPTAGLHFTPELLQKITEKGVKIVKITLHVGLGTFRPVQVSSLKDHKMHTEKYEISQDAADILNSVVKNHGKIVAVGTTSVRTLETNRQHFPNQFTPEKSETSIFIYPGYKFNAVDALITNFHLPKSTLLMLVSAFCEPINLPAATSQSPKNTKNAPITTSESSKNALKMPPVAPESLAGRDLILSAYRHAIAEKYRFFSFGDAMLIK